MSVKFLDDSVAIDGKPENVLIIAHAAAAFDACPKQLSDALVEGALESVKHVAGQAKPGKESSASAETYVNGNGKWQRVAVCLLPSKEASRHAAPGHPHAVTSLVKSKSGSGDLSVFLLLKNPQKETLATCCAIPRAFPTFSVKSGAEAKPPRNVSVYTCTGPEISSSIVSVKIDDLSPLSTSIQEAASLVDAPTNILNVTDYVNRVKEWAGPLDGVSITVISGEELKEGGYGGIYGVGKASTNPPALVILSHNAQNTGKSLCFVGKGIVYDTGGLSIKTKTGMPGMKRDMGGSAGVLGAFHTIVSSGGLPGGKPLHCLLAIAENSVAANATRPDDVHTFYSGKTVEINNTDAEGRLVMADALHHATKHLNPGFLINMATLTGAQASATGLKHAAIFTNNEEFEKLAVSCGQLTGDLTHPLPYTPEFFRKEFKSEIADMKNSQKDRTNCGCAAPATFLSNHIEEYLEAGNPWLHIDMAYPAFSGERGTGYGVALLFLVGRALASKL